MDNTMVELNEADTSHIIGGDSSSWLAVGGIAIGLAGGILVGALFAPVALGVGVIWAAGALGVAGDAAVGYGMARMPE